MYFVFTFALLCDSTYAAGGSLFPSLNIGDVYMGTVVRDEIRIARSGGVRPPGPRAAPPSHLAISACFTVPGCVQLLTSPVDTHFVPFILLFRSATGYTLRYVTIVILRLEVDIVVHHAMVSACTGPDTRSTPWSVAGNVR